MKVCCFHAPFVERVVNSRAMVGSYYFLGLKMDGCNHCLFGNPGNCLKEFPDAHCYFQWACCFAAWVGSNHPDSIDYPDFLGDHY